MKPHLTVLTLATSDIARAVSFYRDGLGWRTKGIMGEEHDNGAVCFFALQDGLKLALWSRTSVAADTGLPVDGPSATELTLGHNVGSEAEVDAAMQVAARAGAKVIREAAPTFWGGYAGYFQDPDGHVWEVVYNPHLDAL